MKDSEDINSLKLTIGSYLMIFIMKFVVYLLTGVMALLAEALHTLSDLFVSGFLLVALYYSRQKADRVHPYGHARAQNVAALVAATLFISFTSFELYKEALPRLFSAHEASYQNLPLAIGALIVSMLIAAAPLYKLLSQKEHGAAAKAQMLELVNDELGLLAALLGTIGIILGWKLADPLSAIVVATIIAYNAVGLFRENLSLLLGRAPDPDEITSVERLVLTVPGVLGVQDVRAEFIGPDMVHADLHILVDGRLTVKAADQIAETVVKRVDEATIFDACTVQIEAVDIEKVTKKHD
jgi:cation diffusion facilitator family transporter